MANTAKSPLSQASAYLRESVAELKKVTWPTREQTQNYTIAVIGLSVATAIFFSVLDLGFSKILEFII